MNKAEKKLAKKVLAYYESPLQNKYDLTRDESLILERWRVHKLLNEDAFIDVTAHNSDHREYIQGLNYPFTSFGDEEIKKNWYLNFRDSKGIVILRDVLTVMAFFVSLIVAIFELLP